MNSTSVAAENFDKFVRTMLKRVKCTWQLKMFVIFKNVAFCQQPCTSDLRC
jgi:hypothetical protein